MQICDMRNIFQDWFRERRGNSPAIFISHSHEDREQAAMVVGLLRAAFCLPAAAIRCTSVDGYRLACGTHTDETLKREVKDCKVLIVLVSESSAQSVYVTFELGARWVLSKPLFPLMISGVSTALLKGPLSGYNALNARMPGQLDQLVAETGDILGLVPEPHAVYRKAIQAFQLK